MKRVATALLFVLFAVSLHAQNLWKTASDIREGGRGSLIGTVVETSEARRQLTLEPDDDRTSSVEVQTDSVSTQYNGFGGTINGKPEIFTGSAGFANVREGDRIEVRGVGRGVGTVMAENVRLLGRAVAAPQTGVGTTRPQTSVATPTAPVPNATTRTATVEGVVQQVNAQEGRVVIVTDRRQVITVRTYANTPVYYRNETYRVSNLEVGDRIRVEPETGSSTTSEVRARSIEVTQSVQEGGGETTRVATITGRVTRVERSLEVIRVDTGRGEVRVDLGTAVDDTSRRVRASDVQIGDRLDVSGHYGTSSDLFVATTVRFLDAADARRAEGEVTVGGELGTVTIYGTVRDTLDNSPQLVLRDSSGRTLRLNVLDDFVVRTKSGGYTTAEKLKVNDSLVVKAFRDADGNYIAQTIRMR